MSGELANALSEDDRRQILNDVLKQQLDHPFTKLTLRDRANMHPKRRTSKLMKKKVSRRVTQRPINAPQSMS